MNSGGNPMASTLKSGESRRLYHQVADQIRSVIEQGRYAPGSRLPPERELALQLGVSRPSLREALIALEIAGRVEFRMGSGVYVCAVPATSGQEALALGESPSEVMQARAVLEGSIVSQAAARATHHGLARLGTCLEDMRLDMHRGDAPVEADRRFHVTLAELTGNPILVQVVAELFDGRQSPISTRLTRRSESARTWEAALQEHELIYHAVSSRDPQEAQAAMSAHLKASRERWIEEFTTAPETSPETSC